MRGCVRSRDEPAPAGAEDSDCCPESGPLRQRACTSTSITTSYVAFSCLAEAQILTEDWGIDDNREHPHSDWATAPRRVRNLVERPATPPAGDAPRTA